MNSKNNFEEKLNNNYFKGIYNYIENANYDYTINNKNNFEEIYNYVINNNNTEIIINNVIKERNLPNTKEIYNFINDAIYYNNKKKIRDYLNSISSNYTIMKDKFDKLTSYNNVKIDFINYNKREEFINKLIDNYNQTKDNEIQKLLLEYLKEEINIQKSNEWIQVHIKRYESSLEEIKSSTTSINLKKYFSCLREAIYSYEEKKLGSNYTFHSSDIDTSLHQGLDLNFSIPKKELPHLLGILNPLYDDKSNKLKNITISLYNKFLEENSLENDSDTYLMYMTNYFENDLMNYLSKNKDVEKGIKKDIEKSFEKCINFIKVYEYKQIPEIILDYSATCEKGNLPHQDNHLRDLITVANKGESSKNWENLEKLINNGYNFTLKDNEFISKIKEEFSDISKIYVKTNPNISNIVKYDGIVYKFEKGRFWSQREPDIYITSYNVNEYKIKKPLLVEYTEKAIRLLCICLKNDLNIKANANKDASQLIKDYSLELTKEKRKNHLNRNHLIDVNKIKNIILSLEDGLSRSDSDIIYTEDNKEDYENLKAYIKEEINNNLKSKINNDFGIADSTDVNKFIKEPTSIRMIHRIALKLMEKDKKLEKNVDIIGYCTERENEDTLVERLDLTEEQIKMLPQSYLSKLYQVKGRFKEKYAKTLQGKSFLQLIYDLRVNGYSYKLDGITDSEKRYYNCKLVIENKSLQDKIKIFLKNSIYDNDFHKKI